MAANITDDTFNSEVLESDKVTLVDFWAEWCQPCKIAGPIVEEFGEEYKDKVNVFKMDVDANSDTPGKYNILSIPTLIFFKNGQPERTMVGVQSKEQLKKVADELLV
jgi:thioredoxin 1